MQVQPDRIAFNWRREPGGGEAVEDYPRYRHIRRRFEATLRTFFEEMRAVGRDPRATWCEVTYINPIELGGSDRPDLSAILRRIGPPPTDLLPPPEDTTFAERFLLRRGDEPFGRFVVTAQPAFRNTDQADLCADANGPRHGFVARRRRRSRVRRLRQGSDRPNIPRYHD